MEDGSGPGGATERKEAGSGTSGATYRKDGGGPDRRAAVVGIDQQVAGAGQHAT
jgi:hypothetical protein